MMHVPQHALRFTYQRGAQIMERKHYFHPYFW